MPLRLLALSRRMIDFVPWREVAQAAPLGSRRRTQHSTQSREGSYELLSNPDFFTKDRNNRNDWLHRMCEPIYCQARGRERLVSYVGVVNTDELFASAL